MSGCDDREWIEARLAATEELIVKYEEAILLVGSGMSGDGSSGAFSYTLDTGQTRITVTRSSLSEARLALQALENRRAVLRSQLGYGGSGNLGPAF